MTAFAIFLILFCGSLFAGLLGALSGLGGGMIIVPLLVLFMHVDIHYAIGASLIAVIATSSGASSAYVREGYSNLRVGIFLETATCIGALCGAALGSHLPSHIISVIFGLVLIYSAITSFYSNDRGDSLIPEDRVASFLKLDSSYPYQGTFYSYHVQHVPLGYAIMWLAGALSGILGIGSGALKVIALDKVMGLPFKVSTTTSNFMIGVTAAASAGIYLHLGYIDPFLTAPIVLGVTLGALAGARLLPHLQTNTLRYLFTCLILVIAIQMLYKGLVHVN